MQFKNYVPKFMLSKTFTTLYDIQQTELDNYNNAIADIKNQCFIETATWGLKFWEEMFSIPIDESRPYQFRRSVIKAKLRGSGTVTVNLIKNVAESFANGDVEVVENITPYTFGVKFVGNKGLPPNLDDLKKAINEIKPAHLAVTYIFTYNTWGMISDKTWADCNALTWSQLRTV